jgi:hypothetical protein
MNNYFPIFNLKEKVKYKAFVKDLNFDGTEIFIASVVSREDPLFKSTSEKAKLISELRNAHVKRLHMSYWAEPIDFLGKKDIESLLLRFNSKEEILGYYSDLTGEHIYNRWIQEYEIAKETGVSAVTFHAIDYFHIDGLWEIDKSKKVVLNAFAKILNDLLFKLNAKGLANNGPIIEVENAGFGLETGVQTAEDYIYLFSKIKNKSNIKVGWDTNHLLHAVGLKNNKAFFLLAEKDKTMLMRQLEKEYSDDPSSFFNEWIEQNLLNDQLLPFLGSIHLSDLQPISEPIFINGQLTSKYIGEIKRLKSPVEQEEYGANLVLTHYDSHLPIGASPVNFRNIIDKVVNTTNGKISILHELKNNHLNYEEYKDQFDKLIL